MVSLPLALKVSRPGFWLITVWCYIAGLRGTGPSLLRANDVQFLVGLAWSTWPINLLIYSWNDLDDENVDSMNARKGKFLLGTKGVPAERVRSMLLLALVVNGLFAVYFCSACGVVRVTAWFLAVIAVNYCYNSAPMRWRAGPPPLDLVVPLGYVLVLLLSSWLNRGGAWPAASTLLFHALMMLRSQLWGQIIDLDCDARCGRRTTAVLLGVVRARKLLALLVAGELAVGCFGVEDTYVASFSALSLAQALVEVFFYPPESPSLSLAAITGAVLTPAGALLLLHVWVSDVFH